MLASDSDLAAAVDHARRAGLKVYFVFWFFSLEWIFSGRGVQICSSEEILI